MTGRSGRNAFDLLAQAVQAQRRDRWQLGVVGDVALGGIESDRNHQPIVECGQCHGRISPDVRTKASGSGSSSISDLRIARARVNAAKSIAALCITAATTSGCRKVNAPDCRRQRGRAVCNLRCQRGVGDHVQERGGLALNVIMLTKPLTAEENIARFDFGICRIAFDGARFEMHWGYEYDRMEERFTLRRCVSPQTLLLSLARYKRLEQKYVGWDLVIPSQFSEFMPTINVSEGGSVSPADEIEDVFA